MVFYLDIGPKFLEADGTLSKDIMPDLLHLNEKSYTHLGRVDRAEGERTDGRISERQVDNPRLRYGLRSDGAGVCRTAERNASTSVAASMSFVVGVPAPWPAGFRSE